MNVAVLQDILLDVRQTVRGLIRNKAFTATVVLTFALAIGAHTAIFSLFYGVLLKPLPYPAADRLVRIYSIHPERGGRNSSSLPEYREWRERSRTIEAMEGYRRKNLLMEGDSEFRIPMIGATPGLLDLTGARASKGRLLQAEDLRPDAIPVAVLSHEFWMTRFGGDTNVIGRAVRFGESITSFASGVIKEDIRFTSYTVIGVMEPIQGPIFGDTFGAVPVQVFVPWIIETDPNRERRNTWNLPLVGRLREGATLTQAQEEWIASAGRFVSNFPTARGCRWSSRSTKRLSPMSAPG
jgi:hypothetical protein